MALPYERALENLSKGRFFRVLLLWRCPGETDVIRRLVWQFEHKRLKYGFPESSKRALARQLGVSHTWVQRLCGEYRADPSRLQITALRRGVACMEQLREAQRETARQRQGGGILRKRISWRKGR